MTTQEQKKFKAKAKKAGVLPAEGVREMVQAATAGIRDADASRTNYGGIAGDQLRQYVAKIERLEEEKADLAADVGDVYREAKANGFDHKVLRKIVQRRKRDRHEVREEEEIMQIYLHALGDMPLFGKPE